MAFGLAPLTYDVACCSSLGYSQSSTRGTSRSPDICHQPTAHWRSAALRHPSVSTTVKYNHQSPLCFLLYPLCIFLPVSFPRSLPPSLLHIPPLLSLKAETYNFPASLRPSTRPTALCMYIYTSTHKKLAQASRPRELPQCIMTDNWLLWVWPQQREPITVTTTSL